MVLLHNFSFSLPGCCVNSQEEEKVVEERLKKLARMLVKTGNKRFLAALSNCISDGIPTLVRACLVTVAWMSSSLSPLHGCNTFQPLACSVLAAKLLDRLSYDRVMEERVLASLSLLNLVRHPGTFPSAVCNILVPLVFVSLNLFPSIVFGLHSTLSCVILEILLSGMVDLVTSILIISSNQIQEYCRNMCNCYDPCIAFLNMIYKALPKQVLYMNFLFYADVNTKFISRITLLALLHGKPEFSII